MFTPNYVSEVMDDINELKSIIKSMSPKGGSPCFYCGMMATDKEHVIPRKWIDQMKEMRSLGFDIEVPKEQIVASCKECNLIASDIIFDSAGEKRKYIATRLVSKYKKFLKYEEWNDAEIEELEGNLKRYVILANEIAILVKRRLNRIRRYL